MNHSHSALSILQIIFLIIMAGISGCKKDNSTETDTQAPTASILFPTADSDVMADTTYTVIAHANDNTNVTTVEFYISGQKCGTDSLAPFEYRWSTQGLSGSKTIMAKAYDESGNIGTSAVIAVQIKGVANHAPGAPHWVPLYPRTNTVARVRS